MWIINLSPSQSFTTEEPVNPRSCSGTYQTPARLTSPGYLRPNTPYYPDDAFCEYNVLLGGGAELNTCFVKVQFVVFDLEQSLNCDKDYLEVRCGLVMHQ